LGKTGKTALNELVGFCGSRLKKPVFHCFCKAFTGSAFWKRRAVAWGRPGPRVSGGFFTGNNTPAARFPARRPSNNARTAIVRSRRARKTKTHAHTPFLQYDPPPKTGKFFDLIHPCFSVPQLVDFSFSFHLNLGTHRIFGEHQQGGTHGRLNQLRP